MDQSNGLASKAILSAGGRQNYPAVRLPVGAMLSRRYQLIMGVHDHNSQQSGQSTIGTLFVADLGGPSLQLHNVGALRLAPYGTLRELFTAGGSRSSV